MFSSFSNKIIIYALTVSCGVLYTSSFSPIDFKFGMFLSLIIFHIILLKGYRKDNGQEIIRIDPRYFRPAEVDHLIGDAEKARKKLGWVPKTSLEEMIREMINHDLEKL